MKTCTCGCETQLCNNPVGTLRQACYARMKRHGTLPKRTCAEDGCTEIVHRNTQRCLPHASFRAQEQKRTSAREYARRKSAERVKTKPCVEADCPKLVSLRASRCDEHAKGWARTDARLRSAAIRNSDPTAHSEAKFLRLYGIPLSQAREMFVTQGRTCSICEIPIKFRASDEAGEKAVFDHDHDTGLPRAWLCGGCNKGIGHLGDDPERVERAAAYLRRHKGK